ncbi:hypothetical protein [Crossiella sp. CA198]|uniref:hypothetical protein n=1 Tax=Crossiella sp. CA198 TaxID=3455607 RepID=UPI003F8D6BB4
MSAAYRVLFQDVLSGYIHGELPMEKLSYTNTLNAPGAAALTIPLDPGVSTVTAQTVVPGAATAVYIERSGRMVWSGLYWDGNPDYTAGTLTMQCEGWLSYFRLRNILTTLQYNQVDQAAIARDLLRNAGTYGPGSLLGMIRYGTETTGVRRDRTFKESERKSLGEAVEELGAVINGFDFEFVSTWDGPDIATTFHVRYPRTGRRREYALTAGTNCEITSATVGGKSVRTFAVATGSGDGPDQVWASAEQFSNVHPRLDQVDSYSDVKEYDTLHAKARGRLRVGAAPVILPTVRLHPGVIGLDAITLGDQVPVHGGGGLVPIQGDWRVTEIAVSVDQSGDETTDLTVAPVEAFEDA